MEDVGKILCALTNYRLSNLHDTTSRKDLRGPTPCHTTTHTILQMTTPPQPGNNRIPAQHWDCAGILETPLRGTSRLATRCPTCMQPVSWRPLLSNRRNTSYTYSSGWKRAAHKLKYITGNLAHCDNHAKIANIYPPNIGRPVTEPPTYRQIPSWPQQLLCILDMDRSRAYSPQFTPALDRQKLKEGPERLAPHNRSQFSQVCAGGSLTLDTLLLPANSQATIKVSHLVHGHTHTPQDIGLCPRLSQTSTRGLPTSMFAATASSWTTLGSSCIGGGSLDATLTVCHILLVFKLDSVVTG